MMKLLKRIIKRIVLSFAIIYSFNLLISSFNLNVAVNQYSVGLVYFTGIPGVISLIVINYLIK